MTLKCSDNAANTTLTVPLLKKFFIVNNTLGSHQTTVGGATGATVVVPTGVAALCICDGTDVYTLTSLATTAGVVSLGGVSGALALGANLSMSGSTLELGGLGALAVPAAGVLFSDGATLGDVTFSADFVYSAGSLSLTGLEHTANKGVAGGYASLDGGGKVPTSQLPGSALGAMQYQGTWNASTNSPVINSGTGTQGWFYKVGTAGTTTVDGNSQWNAGDMIAFDGTVWDKFDGIANEVISVAGKYGVVTLVAADIGGLAASATVDTTNAMNITGGVLPAGRLPSPGTATLGGVEAYIAPSHQFINQIGTDGTVSSAQPGSSDISGLGAMAALGIPSAGFVKSTGTSLTSSSTLALTDLPTELTNMPLSMFQIGTMQDGQTVLHFVTDQTITLQTGLAGSFINFLQHRRPAGQHRAYDCLDGAPGGRHADDHGAGHVDHRHRR